MLTSRRTKAWAKLRDRRSHMTTRLRATRMVLAATAAIASLGAAAPARATDCPLLSEGSTSPVQGCYYLDVPEGVDLLQLYGWSDNRPGAGGDITLRSHTGDVLCYFGTPANQGCAVPGPQASRMTVWVGFNGSLNSGISVHFKEATPVIGAAVGSISRGGALLIGLDEGYWGTGYMYRFDGLETKALISLASTEDVDLSVRRGAPPSRDETDCISAQSSDTPLPGGNLSAGSEACGVPSGAGSVYAFVTLRSVTFVRTPCQPLLGSCLPPPSIPGMPAVLPLRPMHRIPQGLRDHRLPNSLTSCSAGRHR